MGEAPNPDLSFTVQPMEMDAAQFADAGFATAEDFEPGHFDEPEDKERLAELMMRNPFPPELDSGSSTISNQPPTHDDIQARLARLGEELQALALIRKKGLALFRPLHKHSHKRLKRCTNSL